MPEDKQRFDQDHNDQQPPISEVGPMAAIAYYGPDDQTATKAVVAIIDPTQNILDSISWQVESGDIRFDESTSQEIAAYIKNQGVAKAVIAEGILGCPHVPGVDYPAGETCPYCPYWAEKET